MRILTPSFFFSGVFSLATVFGFSPFLTPLPDSLKCVFSSLPPTPFCFHQPSPSSEISSKPPPPPPPPEAGRFPPPFQRISFSLFSASPGDLNPPWCKEDPPSGHLFPFFLPSGFFFSLILSLPNYAFRLPFPLFEPNLNPKCYPFSLLFL